MKNLSFLGAIGAFFVLGVFSVRAVSPAGLYLEKIVGKTYSLYPLSERDTWLQIYERVHTKPNEEQIIRRRALAIKRMQWEFQQKMRQRREEMRRIEEERENVFRQRALAIRRMQWEFQQKLKQRREEMRRIEEERENASRPYA